MAESPDVTCIAPWFGTDRMIGEAIAEELDGCSWLGIPFGGGMGILTHVQARTIVVNDLHRHVINLARCIQSPAARLQMLRYLTVMPFHPDVLAEAQEYCHAHEPEGKQDIIAACHYFVSQWMGRSGKAGTDAEFKGGLALRWDAGGGDSNVRYRSAYRGMVAWQRIMRRCSFDVDDAFRFLCNVVDHEDHAIYCDPPFPGPGDKYRHKFSLDQQNQLSKHLLTFQHARVVCRFYDHPLIRQLYAPEYGWTWRHLKGRKSSNADAPEVLIINGPSKAKQAALGLFE